MKLKETSESDPRARPKPFTFYPPKNNSFLIGLAKLSIKRSIRRKLRVTEIEIGDDDLERLRRLEGRRCLVTPSHSGGFEPHIMMYLSKRLQHDFNYVAAIEREKVRTKAPPGRCKRGPEWGIAHSLVFREGTARQLSFFGSDFSLI